MDEARVRDLLYRTADTETTAPASAVDVAAARAVGRRRRRIRRVYVPWGAPIAAALAIALIAALVVAASGLHSNGGPVLSRPTVVPRQFNPDRPYVLFGWLPPGASTGAIVEGSTSEDFELFGVGEVFIHVGVRRYCAPSSAHPDKLKVTCDGVPLGQNPTPAHPVNGGQAFWDGPSTLVWQYGPGAWALLAEYRHVYSAGQLRRIAATLTFGSAGPVKYPFQYAGVLPHSWTPRSEGDFVIFQSQSADYNLEISNPVISQALSISVWPASQDSVLPAVLAPASGCVSDGKDATTRRYVTLDGARALLWTRRFGPQSISRTEQGLCAHNIDGMSVDMTLYTNVPGTSRPLPGLAQLGTVLTIFRQLRLLGPEVRNWTTQPVKTSP
jgi:hypothetical protein